MSYDNFFCFKRSFFLSPKRLVGPSAYFIGFSKTSCVVSLSYFIRDKSNPEVSDLPSYLCPRNSKDLCKSWAYWTSWMLQLPMGDFVRACICKNCLHSSHLFIARIDGKRDRRTYIKICFNLEKTAKTIKMMQKGFGDECIKKTHIQNLYKGLKSNPVILDLSERY